MADNQRVIKRGSSNGALRFENLHAACWQDGRRDDARFAQTRFDEKGAVFRLSAFAATTTVNTTRYPRHSAASLDLEKIVFGWGDRPPPFRRCATLTASKLQPFSALPNSHDELWARLASNTPRPPIGKHVLIAGVFGPNNQLLKQLAELQGSTTILTSVGEEALQAPIKDHPDLIIVDVMGSREFELGRILKGDVRTREIPLIGVSAQDEHLVVAAGYDEFVAKPIGSRNFGLLNFLKLLDRLLLP